MSTDSRNCLTVDPTIVQEAVDLGDAARMSVNGRARSGTGGLRPVERDNLRTC